MKHDGYPTRLQSLLRAHAAGAPPEPASTDLVDLLVHSFLVWEATVAQADAAMARIRHATVSFNDFRVCLVNEVADLLGPRYPRVQERAIRVRAAVNDLFRREHQVSLERASNLSKRDAKNYIESLQGMVPFVSARVSLLGLGVHGVPVDDQTLGALVQHGVLHEQMTVPEATGWLQRHIAADKAVAAHHALQRAAETFGAKAARSGARSAKSGRSAAGAAPARQAPRTASEPTPRRSSAGSSRGAGAGSRSARSRAGRSRRASK